MVPLRSALVVDAALPEVERALWSLGLWSRAWSGRGFAVAAGAGDQSADRARLRPGTAITLIGRTRFGRGWRAARPALFRVADDVAAAGPGGPRAVGPGGTEVSAHPHGPAPSASTGRIAGPTLAGATGSVAGWTLRTWAVTTGAGVLVTVEAANPGYRWRPGVRERVLRFQQLVLGLVALIVAAESPGPRIVVAGVIIEDGRVLAARRRYPPEVAGRWECPGGKVEPGEREQQALIRELHEELGIDTEVDERIGPSIRISDSFVLHAYRARIVNGRPRAQEHDQMDWVEPERLHTVDWLPSDGPLIDAIFALMAVPDDDGAGGTVR